MSNQEHQGSVRGHTPGPWDFEAGFLITRAHCGGTGIPMFEVTPVTGTNQEILANLSLLTSAPDLLEALKGERDWHEQQADLAFDGAREANAQGDKADERRHMDRHAFHNARWSLLSDLIAQAEGRNNTTEQDLEAQVVANTTCTPPRA